MKRYIGVDAGGTKTKTVLYDENGRMLVESITGHGNILVDEEVALANICKGIEKVLRQTSELYLLVGIAGVETAGKVRSVTEFLQNRFPMITKVKVINDGELGMIAQLQGKDGVFAIAGTGSVVYAKNTGKMQRVGGFGHLLGDEGGAYWIGRQLFRSFAQTINTKTTDKGLSYELMKFERVEKGQEYALIRKFYTLDKKTVAEYALFVDKMAEKGNQEAMSILKKAGDELAKQVKEAIMLAGFTEQVILAVSGSVLLKSALVRKTMISQLVKVSLQINEIDPTKASYFYWRKHEC